jgi:cytochrome P450
MYELPDDPFAVDRFGRRYGSDELPWTRRFDPERKAWLFSSMQDALEIMANVEDLDTRFAQRPAQTLTPEARQALQEFAARRSATLFTSVGDNHEALKVTMIGALSDAMKPRPNFAALVRRAAQDTVQAMRQRAAHNGGRVDLVEYSWLYALLIICRQLFVDDEEAFAIRRASIQFCDVIWGDNMPEERQLAGVHGIQTLYRWCRDLLATRLAEIDAGNDRGGFAGYILRRIAQQFPGSSLDAKRVQVEKATGFIYGMIIAGHVTAGAAAVNVPVLLLANGLWGEFTAAASDVEAAKAWVSEGLRLAPSVHVAFRWCSTDKPVDICQGVTLHPSEVAYINVAQANRDPKHFGQDANDFRPGRDQLDLTFGHDVGSWSRNRECPGKIFGFLETVEFLRVLAEELPHLRLLTQKITHYPNRFFCWPNEAVVAI